MTNWFFSANPVMFHAGLLLVRITTGVFMIIHGWEVFEPETMAEYFKWDMFKDSSSDQMMVYAGKAAELIAGVLIFCGLFTRLGAIIAIGTFSYIAFFVGHGKVWYDDQYPFLFVLLALVFFFTGAGKWSADHLLFKK